MKSLKIIFNRPIYRKDILKYASKHYFIDNGMCNAIECALDAYRINATSSCIFSKYFNPSIAINQFGAIKAALHYSCYWWSTNKYGWEYRKLYFKWLIKQYKDDKEDLRKYR